MMLKLNQKQNQKQSQKLNKIKAGVLMYLGCIGQTFCMANTLELTIQPHTSFFYFSLPSNASTGYKWSLQSYDKSKLTYDHSDYKVSNPELIGGGGVERFYFYVTDTSKPMDTHLVLKYARSWEKDNYNLQDVHIVTKK